MDEVTYESPPPNQPQDSWLRPLHHIRISTDMAKAIVDMLQQGCDQVSGGMIINEDSMLDFGGEPDGLVRTHEIRFSGGDSTSDIWV